MRPFLLASILPVLLLAGCGGSTDNGGGGSSSSSGGTISVSETDFKITLDSEQLDPGSYTFDISNDGQFTHALNVEGGGSEASSDMIEPGGSATLDVTLKDGSYTLYCPLSNHRARGMETSLTVGSGSAGAGGAATTTDDNGDDNGRGGGGYGGGAYSP
jgi:plastocyanin